MNQAEAELAAIPAVTSVPTQPLPSPSPFPEYTRADPLAIATEVAIVKASSTATPTPLPSEQNGSNIPPDISFPLLEDGQNFRRFPGGLWYDTAESAADAQDFYIDRMTYLRWDDYTVGETGEGYGQVQFVKNFEEVQVFVWENPGLEHTSVVVLEVEQALEFVQGLTTESNDSGWLVIGEPDPDNEGEEEGVELEEPATEFLSEYPLPIVNLFYILRMRDAGWQLIPTERLGSYAFDLQFFRNEERIVMLLQDNGIGTTVTLIE